MTNTGITLHLVRTDATATTTTAREASRSWDVTVADVTAATEHLSGYRNERVEITASATDASGAWIGTGRAGHGTVNTAW